MPKAPPTDEALMGAYQQGDTSAFETLYDRYAGRVYGYLKRRLSRREEQDEVFQQIFMKLHRSRSQYSSRYPFSQWLFVISRSVLLDYQRKRGISPTEIATAGIESLETVPSRTSGLEPFDGLETRSHVDAPWDRLTPEQSQVIQWRVLEERSFAEIAARLSRSEASVRQILSRALKKLRQSGFGSKGTK